MLNAALLLVASLNNHPKFAIFLSLDPQPVAGIFSVHVMWKMQLGIIAQDFRSDKKRRSCHLQLAEASKCGQQWAAAAEDQFSTSSSVDVFFSKQNLVQATGLLSPHLLGEIQDLPRVNTSDVLSFIDVYAETTCTHIAINYIICIYDIFLYILCIYNIYYTHVYTYVYIYIYTNTMQACRQ